MTNVVPLVNISHSSQTEESSGSDTCVLPAGMISLQACRSDRRISAGQLSRSGARAQLGW